MIMAMDKINEMKLFLGEDLQSTLCSSFSKFVDKTFKLQKQNSIKDKTETKRAMCIVCSFSLIFSLSGLIVHYEA